MLFVLRCVCSFAPAFLRYGSAGVGLMVAFLIIMGITLLNLLIAFLTAAHGDVQKTAKAKVRHRLPDLSIDEVADLLVG